MKYLRMLQTSLVVIVFAIIGMTVVIRLVVQYLPGLIIALAVVVIFGMMIGRRSPF